MDKGLLRGGESTSHASGNDIEYTVVETGQNVLIEGDEYHLCKAAMLSDEIHEYVNKTNREILDDIYTRSSCMVKEGEAHAGDFIICKLAVRDDTKRNRTGTIREIISMIQGENGCKVVDEGQYSDEFKDGGEIDSDTYKKWKSLVNMSKGELEKFYNSQEGKDAGLDKGKAKELGISYGRESARWIMKMKDTPVSEWTPEMWKWAKKQISFISRMSFNKGGLYDKKGRKTRKHTSLLIWGHNPEKYSDGGEVAVPDLILGKHYSGKIVKNIVSSYGSSEGTDMVEFAQENIKNNDEYILDYVSIDKILQYDTNLHTFVSEGSDSDYLLSNSDFSITEPILLGDSGDSVWGNQKNIVLDGYHRVLASIINKEDKILAFIKVDKNNERVDYIRFKDGGEISSFNKAMKNELKTLKEDTHNDLALINEAVAKRYINHLAASIGEVAGEIELANKSKNPTNHFQLICSTHSGKIIMAVFVYVDDNHKVVKSKSSIELLDADYNTIKKFKDGGEISHDNKEVLKGGLSDGMTLHDIAKKHKKSYKELMAEFKKGVKVESEHTKNTKMAMEIAKDHLFENPKYYTLLEKYVELGSGGSIGENFYIAARELFQRYLVAHGLFLLPNDKFFIRGDMFSVHFIVEQADNGEVYKAEYVVFSSPVYDQSTVQEFLKAIQAESHYLYDKDVDSWDEYDDSNWMRLLRSNVDKVANIEDYDFQEKMVAIGDFNIDEFDFDFLPMSEFLESIGYMAYNKGGSFSDSFSREEIQVLIEPYKDDIKTLRYLANRMSWNDFVSAVANIGYQGGDYIFNSELQRFGRAVPVMEDGEKAISYDTINESETEILNFYALSFSNNHNLRIGDILFADMDRAKIYVSENGITSWDYKLVSVSSDDLIGFGSDVYVYSPKIFRDYVGSLKQFWENSK